MLLFESILAENWSQYWPIEHDIHSCLWTHDFAANAGCSFKRPCECAGSFNFVAGLENDGAVYLRSLNFLRLTWLGQWRCCGVSGVQLNCLPIFDFFRSRAPMCFCISSHYLNRLATINFFALTLPTVVSQNPLPVQVSFINRLIPKFSILSNRGVPLFLDAGGECFAFELGTCYQVFVITIF